LSKKKKDSTIKNIAIGGGSAYVGNKVFVSGSANAQDIVNVYTGTSKEAAKSIRKTGLQGKFGGKVWSGVTDIGDVAERNKGLAFVTTKRKSAVESSRFAQKVSTTGRAVDITDVLGKVKTGLVGKKGSTLRFKIPSNVLKNSFLPDPENKLIMDKVKDAHRSMGQLNNPVLKYQRKSMAKNLDARKATRFISKRRIAGNLPKKIALGLFARRLANTAAAKPLQFAKGLGKVGLGLGLLGFGAITLTRAIKRDFSRAAAPKPQNRGDVRFVRIRGRVVPIRSK